MVLAIQKQPGANTLALTERLDALMTELQAGLPAGMLIETGLFRQADFIQAAVTHVQVALRDGAIMVLVIVFAFLGSAAATAITVLAIPLSLLAAVLVVTGCGGSADSDAPGPSAGVAPAACAKVFAQSVPAAADNVLLVVDRTASVADQPMPAALAADLSEVSRRNGSLTVVAVDGDGAAPRILAKHVALSTSGECPCQSTTSPTTRNGSRERYDLVGLPGNFLSVRLGSSSIAPVGSTK